MTSPQPWEHAELTAEHDCSGFRCGHPELDAWLQRHALRSQQQDITRIYVWTAPASENVMAYYSVQPTQIVAADVSRAVSGGNTVIPAYLIARLVLHVDLQHEGLGRHLLRDALETIVAASDRAAGRAVVVDPIDLVAREFYLRNDFTETKGEGGRLVLKIATLRAAFGRARP